jgi:iron complex outermembrane receptor protein
LTSGRPHRELSLDEAGLAQRGLQRLKRRLSAWGFAVALVEMINALIAGWVNYLRVGNSSRAFAGWQLRSIGWRRRSSLGYSGAGERLSELEESQQRGKPMKGFASHCLLLVTPMLALPLLSQPALAQQVGGRAAESSSELQEVVVTARRVEESLQDVPMSISVYSQADLTDRNIVSANDLALYTPALSISNQFGSDAASLVIRGFSQDIGTSPTVGTYFADVVQPRGGFGGTTIHAGEGAGPGSFFDLENVQVLKGPQGTLFGRNTTGGAVLLVPKKPTSEFGGYFEASAGNYGLERTQGVLNLPVNDKLRIRLGVDQETQRGYIYNISNIGPRDFNNTNYIAARLSVDVDVTSNLENYTVASFSHSNNNGSDTQLVACDPTQGLLGTLSCAQLAREGARRGPRTVDNSVSNAQSYIQEWQVINTTTWNASDKLTFKNIASYSQLRVINDSGLFGTNFQLGGFPLLFTAEDTPPNTDLVSQQSFTEEPRLTGSAFDGRLTWQAGLYWEMSYPQGISGSSGPNLISCSNFQQLQCFDLAASIFGLPPGSIGSVGRRTGTVTWRDYGAYAQDTYAINNQFSLTTGLRYSDDITAARTTRYVYYFPAPNTPLQACETFIPKGSCVVSDRQKSSAPTGVVNLQYKPTEGLLSYVQYARGYRQGGILSTGPIGYTTFQPEHLNAYEIGVKSTFQGPVPGTVNAAIFYNDFNNQQILGTFVSSIPGAPPNAGILNVGKSRIYGLDLDSTLRPTRDLTLNIGYTYLSSKLVKVNQQTVSGFYDVFGPNEPQGSALALTPKHKLSLTATYRLPLDARIGKISPGVTWTYTARELVYGVGPYSFLPATHLLNLNLNWESIYGSPLDAEFFMTNVTDLHYPNYIDNFANPPGSGAAAYGLVAESFGPPRIYAFRLRYHF